MALECILTIGINIIKINRYNPNCVIEYCVYGKLFKNSRQIVSNKISIITVSYNQAKFLEENILSVIEQNYPNVEHIIVDAGSTDGTLKILKKYNHLIWTSEPDDGQSGAPARDGLLFEQNPDLKT